MTALVWAAGVLLYLLPTVIFARRFYGSYPWNYEDVAMHSFLSLLLGLIWPLSIVVVAVTWRNPTASQRQRALWDREERVARMERELGL